MQIVVPMAGAGDRYRRAGHTAPKPLIEIDGRPMIEHVVAMFPGESRFLFICNRDHLASTNLRAALERLVPGCRIAAIDPHKLGPVHTVLAAESLVDDEEPAFVTYCDYSVWWTWPSFKSFVEERRCAGAVTAYRGFHPHSLGPNLYAYLREREGRMLEIKEKGCFTDDRMSEYASAGGYYFARGDLLKRYFHRAVAADLRTNGEYYASTPYNAMIDDGLEVLVYELEHFLQWGTPEDMEEYAAWSRYFDGASTWRPSLPASRGVTLLPMAGEGARFAAAGFTVPKPLVPVAGIPMVERAIATLPPTDRLIAICRPEHLASGDLPAVLRAGRQAEVLTADRPTDGQARTCLIARDRLDPEEPVLVAPCDATVVWDEEAWDALVRDPGVDGAVWAFRNHPHANRHPRQYGWVAEGPGGAVQGVSCKVPLPGDVRAHAGIVGIFWFRRAATFLRAVDEMIARDARVRGELYVDVAAGIAAESGARLRTFDVRHYVGFGVPDDVRTYEYWAAYFAKARPRLEALAG